jgi:hypothetical protein
MKMTVGALELMDELLCDAADYPDAVGQLDRHRRPPCPAAATARQLGVRERVGAV